MPQPHFHDETGIRKPTSGYLQDHELTPFTGWRMSDPCEVCGKSERMFFMKSGGGKITRFWSFDHPLIPMRKD